MSVKFDHTMGNMGLAMGINDERTDELDALVLFTIIDRTMMVESLFDDEDDAPLNLRTKTGLLETVFESSNNEAERIYLTFEYSKLDQHMEHNHRGFKDFLRGLTLLYKGADGDKEKFIEKFINYKNEAKKAYEAGEFGQRDDD